MLESPSPANRERWQALAKFLKAALVALAALFLLLFLYTALRRLRYPFELEWIESGMLVSMGRIVHGQGLYVPPTLTFVPYLYAPLYLYVTAAMSKLVGETYTALRLVSILSTLGTAAIIYLFVGVEARRSRVAAVASSGLFLALYPLVEAFYDIGRVDSLFVFLLLSALLLTRRGHPVVAAIAWVLCFQTKQSVLVIAMVMLCWQWERPRRMLLGLGSFLLLLFGSFRVINLLTHRWYDFYLFRLVRGLGIIWRQACLYVPNTLLAPLGVAFLLCLVALVLTGVRLRSPALRFYLLGSLTIYGSVGFVAAHRGAAMNAYVPAYVWTVVLFGLALSRLLWRLETSREPLAPALACLTLAAALIQMVMFIYNPGRYIPTAAVLAARNGLLDQVRAIPGDVWIVNHSHDATLAGKPLHAEGEALGAVMEAKVGTSSSQLSQQMEAALSGHRFAAVVIDGPMPTQRYNIQKYYPLAVAARTEQDKFLTSQPRWILLPCDVSEALVQQLAAWQTLSVREESCPLRNNPH